MSSRLPDEILEERLRRGLARLAEAAASRPATPTVPAREPRLRARNRRWWWLPLLPALSAIGAGGVLAIALLVPLASSRPSPTTGAAVSGASAFEQLPGTLAFVSAGHLYTAEPGSRPQPVPGVANPASEPQWSPDGQWLAYLGPNRGLHVVSVGGQQVITGITGSVVAITWSPTADILAVLPAGGPESGRLMLLSLPAGSAGAGSAGAGSAGAGSAGAGSAGSSSGLGISVALSVTYPPTASGRIASFAWSPGGRRIAVVPASPAPGDSSHIDVLELPGTAQASGQSAPAPTPAPAQAPTPGGATADAAGITVRVLPYTAPSGAGLLLGGWWPNGEGLLAWIDPAHSLAAEATGLELVSIPLTSPVAMPLARTFVYLPWLAWSPGGNRLLLVHASGALPWAGTGLALCRPAQGTCHTLPEPPGSVSLDPTWSPSGKAIAFVRAADARGLPQGVGLDAWYSTRSLWTAAPDGANAHAVPDAGHGVAEPRFGPTGSSIAFVTGSAIEVLPAGGGRPTVLAASLAGALDSGGPDGYGKLPWGGLATWGP